MESRQPKRSLARVVPMIILMVVAVAAFGVPQTEPASDERRFYDAVDVDLVNLHVMVTDPQGRPVTGVDA